MAQKEWKSGDEKMKMKQFHVDGLCIFNSIDIVPRRKWIKVFCFYIIAIIEWIKIIPLKLEKQKLVSSNISFSER